MAEVKYKIAFELDEQSIQNLSIQLNEKMRQAMAQTSGIFGGTGIGGAPQGGLILDPSGRPVTSGLPPKPTESVFDRFKSTPAYQLLESQGNLRAATSGLASTTSGKTLEEFLADRILKTKGGGDSMIAKALTELQEEARKLSKEFSSAREEHEKLMKSSNRTTEQEVEISNKLVNLKKAEADLADKVAKATGMSVAPTGGAGSLMSQLAGALGPASMVGGPFKALQMAMQLPLTQMMAQGALGGIEARNYAAMGGINLEDIMRGSTGFQAGARGQQVRSTIGSVAGAGAMGAAGGAGLAALLGLSGPVGWGVAGLGALGFGAYNLISGKATAAGAGGYEAFMQAQIEAMGARGPQYEAYLGAAGAMTPLRMGYGIGERQLMGGFGPGSALGGFARQYGFSPNELMGIGGAGMGLGGRRGMGAGMIGTAAMAQGLLMAPTDFMQGTGAFLGAAGNDVNRASTILTEVMTKAFATGLNQSGMTEAVRAISSIAQSGAATAGAPGAAAGFITAGAASYGGADVGVRVGQNLAGATSNMLGRSNLGNWIGLSMMTQGSIGRKLSSLPAFRRVQAYQILATADPANLEATKRAFAQEGVFFTDDELQQVARSKMAGQSAVANFFADPTAMRNIMTGRGMGGGLGALMTMAQGTGSFAGAAELINPAEGGISPIDRWLANVMGGDAGLMGRGRARAGATFAATRESPLQWLLATQGQSRFSMGMAGAEVAPGMLEKLVEQREKLDRGVTPEMRGLDAFNAVGDASGRVATKMDFLDRALDGVLAKLRQYGYSDYQPKNEPTIRATEGGAAKTGQIGTNTNWWK